MSLYDQATVKEVLKAFADDPIGFGTRLFDEGNYPVPIRTADNPFVRHEDLDVFYKALVEYDDKHEGLVPSVVVGLFLGVFLPYVTTPNADYMLDEDTVYAMIALGAAAHVEINAEDSEQTIEVISSLEPLYSVAIMECVKTIGSEWQCGEAVPALQYAASLLIPSICE